MANATKGIRIYDYEGHWLDDFPSIRLASTQFDLDEAQVRKAADGRVVHIRGFQFRELKPDGTPEKIPSAYENSTSGRKIMHVAKYYKGYLICVYNSIGEAEEKNLIAAGNITHAIQRGHEYKGFTFKEIL